MTTSDKAGHSPALFRVAVLAGGLVLAGLAAQTAHSVAGDSRLLARCYPAAQLAARDDERRPIRGAPGSAQRIPPQTSAPQVVPGLPRGAVRRVTLPPGKKLIALTLDLCEQPGEVAGYDGAIFDTLRQHGVKATVFAGGKWLMSHPERARQLIADPLLELGNHGWAHRNVRSLSGSDLMQEIRGPEAAFQLQRTALAQTQCAASLPDAIAGLQPRLGYYRFPFGACNPAALEAMHANGLLAIQWDVSTGDATPSESAASIARTLTQDVRPGSIILAHANGRGHHTAEALPIAIPALKAKGYTFVTVSELLAAGKPVIVETCYDHRPGDTDRYDALFQSRREISEKRDGRPAASALPR